MKTGTLFFDTANGPSTAYVAMPDSGPGTRAVILIHEWWGLNDHIKDIAARYSAEGFTAIAPDLYRGVVLTDPKDASKAMHGLQIEDGVDTISCAMEAARNEYGITSFGVTGYCMGGTFALRAACDLKGIGAAAPFYGDIPEEKVLSRLETPTVFISGTRDGWITPDKVGEMEAIASRHSLPLQSVKYDSDHAFFNDTRPDVYDEKSAKDAWKVVTDFFEKKL